MSNYTKTTNFATKDALASGNPAKIVKGTEIDTEFNNIAVASSTKANKADPVFTGTATLPVTNASSLSIGGDGVTVTGIKDEDDMASNSATKLASQQSIKAYVDSQVTAQDLDVTDGTNTIAIDLDSEALSLLGGTGVTSTAAGNGVTLAIDSTVATLADTQTLSNKTLATPVISGNLTTDGTIDGRDVAADGAKLDGIEALADVTDTANVTAAGALMDSELTNITAVKALDQGVATTDSPSFVGLTASGEITANGGIALGDSDKATFGASDDLQIYHDGSHSQIKDAGTGNLYIKATSGVLIQDNDTGTNRITTSAAGPVYVYHAGDQKLATTSTGIDVTGSVVADGLTVDTSSVGGFKVTNEATSGVRLTAYQGTSNSNVRTAYVDAQEFVVSTGSPTGTSVTEKFRVKSTGIDVTGTVTADGFQTDIANTTTNLLARNSSNAAVYLQNGGTGDVLHVRSGNMSAGQGDLHLKVANNGDISFYEDTGTTAKLFWDASAESLGIGTSSPSAAIHAVNSTSVGESIAIFESTATKNGYVYINGDANRRKSLVFQSAGVDKFSMGVGDSDELSESSFFIGAGKTGGSGADLVINSSGNVGIGTDSPIYPLVVSNSGAQGLEFIVGTTNFIQSYNRSTADYTPLKIDAETIAFGTDNGAERMRIDSSGNLLVGKTSADDFSSAGAQIEANGQITNSVASAPSLRLNRGGNDGDIIEFNKSGLSVGSIGSNTGGLYIADAGVGFRFDSGGTDDIIPCSASGAAADASINLGSSGARFKDLHLSGTINITGGKISSYAADANAPYFADAGNVGIRFSQAGVDDVVPCSTTGADRDNAINLGASDNRFKDLYLSGGVYLGGTDAANKLDDYEEGTWTPTLGGGATATNMSGKYTKVGRLVTVFLTLENSTISGTPDYIVSGLPFTNGAERAALSVTYLKTFNTACETLAGFITGNGSNMEFLGLIQGGTWLAANLTAGTGRYVYAVASYQTA